MTEKLKACPNCQEEDVAMKGVSVYGRSYTCEVCGYSTGLKKTPAEAISAWNQRADLQPFIDLADEMHKSVDENAGGSDFANGRWQATTWWERQLRTAIEKAGG